MKKSYDIIIDKITEDGVYIRFYSNYEIELRVSQAKAFYTAINYDDWPYVYISIKLNNNYKVQFFTGFPKPFKTYSSLTFIAKNLTNKKQSAIRIPLCGDTIKYTSMVYEGV